MRHATFSKRTAFRMLARLAEWDPPEGVMHDLTLIPYGNRFAVLVNLQSGDLVSVVEMTTATPDEDTFAELTREADRILEASWEAIIEAPVDVMPFDVATIPRG